MIVYIDNEKCKNRGLPGLSRLGFLESKDYRIERHFDHLSFSFVMRGSRGWLKTEGKKTDVFPPFFLLSLPGEEKSYAPYKDWDEFYFVLPPDAVEILFGGQLPFRGEGGVIPASSVPSEIEDYIKIMMKLMERPQNEELCLQLNSLARLVLSLSFWRKQEESMSEMEKRMDSVEYYIRCNYARPLKLTHVAEKFGISYPNFRRLWKKRFSASPHRLIMELRNAEAKELLQTTNLPIGSIAERTGFDEQRYFARFFRTINGISPSAYRYSSRNDY